MRKQRGRRECDNQGLGVGDGPPGRSKRGGGSKWDRIGIALIQITRRRILTDGHDRKEEGEGFH